MNIQRAVTAIVGALTIFALVAGFRLVGSPEHRRRVDADNRQIAEIKSIVRFIAPLKAAPSALPSYVPLRDYSGGDFDTRPVSTVRYSYRKIDAQHFELCATFLADGTDTDTGAGYLHGVGRTCYRYDVRTDDVNAPERVAPVRRAQ